MRRVVAAFRLLSPKRHEVGPIQVTADYEVPADGIGLLLDGLYVAVTKLRGFGLDDADFSGKLHIAARKPGEKAHGRFFPDDDKVLLFYPHVRGVPDWLWTLVHELGHRVWYRVLSDTDRDVWSEIASRTGQPFTPSAADALTRMVVDRPDPYPMWFFFKKHFGDDPEKFRDWLLTLNYSREFPTDYDNVSPVEAFADVFADTVLGRGHAGDELRRAGAFIRKVFAGLMAPYRNRRVFESFLLEQEDGNFLQSQVDLPEMAEALKTWIDKNLDPTATLRIEQRPHVTLVYGLDRRDMSQIHQVAEDFGRPIRVIPGAINMFDASDHDVIYIDAIGGALRDLRESLLRLPHTRPQRHNDYVPHITIAYLKKGAGRRFLGQSPFKALIRRESFVLIDSAGIESSVPTVRDDPSGYEPVLFDDTEPTRGLPS